MRRATLLALVTLALAGCCGCGADFVLCLYHTPARSPWYQCECGDPQRGYLPCHATQAKR